MYSEQQLENLKILIKESGALSLVEQEEWLSLLPFMNDKQLMSLEAMLASVGSKISIRQPVPVKVTKKNTDESTAQVELSDFGSLPTPPLPPAYMKAVQADAPELTRGESKATSVGDFIKQNFSEVSGGVKSEEKASVQSAESLATGAKRPLELTRPKATSVHPELPAIPSPVPHSQAKPIPPLPEPKAEKPASLVATAQVAARLQPQRAEQAKAVKPGLDREEALISGPKQSTTQVPLQAKEPALVSKTETPIPEVAQEGVASEELTFVAEPIIKLSSLEDVKKLNVATLRGSGAINISQRLRELSDKHGYFTVEFALEASPLYKAYLAIGSKALKEQKTFEEVEQEMDKDKSQYITKPEFEAFTDMLRKLRSVA
jgi:hypothetical protein